MPHFPDFSQIPAAAAQCLYLLGLLLPLAVVAQPSGDEGVRAVLDRYIAGHATGRAEEMRGAFLPTAHIEGLRDGKFVSWTLEEYCALFRGQPAPDEASRRRTVDHVEIAGTVATARMTLLHGNVKFTDMFLLVKQNGAWKIANKIYHAEPLAAPALPRE